MDTKLDDRNEPFSHPIRPLIFKKRLVDNSHLWIRHSSSHFICVAPQNGVEFPACGGAIIEQDGNNNVTIVELLCIRGCIFKLRFVRPNTSHKKSLELAPITENNMLMSSSVETAGEINGSDTSNLSWYLTRKKPKKRMIEIEENELMINFRRRKHKSSGGKPKGICGSFEDWCGGRNEYFEIPLGREITELNISEFSGIVLIKRKDDHPQTEEPVVVGYTQFKMRSFLIARKNMPCLEKAFDLYDDR
mmetsp:Transcript_47254/g.56830  ORF Transcript_47254/g.56830 Transcript_47254/m.56830 type:complete len:248 (-) Transcript_47254:2057-2800(-)